MKKILLLIALLLVVVSACTVQTQEADEPLDENTGTSGEDSMEEPTVPSDAVVCTDEQKAAEICTLEYAPVCGNDGVTYGNKCQACSSRPVEWYVEGECPAKTVICTDEQKAAKACTREYVPVCGDNGQEYGNKCEACSSGEIDSYQEGSCPE